MNARMTATIVCLALANVPSAAAAAKTAKPAAPVGQSAAAKVARKTITPKTAVKTARRPALQVRAAQKAPAAIAKAYAAMPASERLAIQSDLAWTGYYQGPPGGDFDDERIIDAVKLFQTAVKDRVTGILTRDERAHLAAAALPAQGRVGWRIIDDPATGARFGVPEKLVSPIAASGTGSHWTSGHAQIRIDDFQLGEANLSVLFEQERKTPRGRHADSAALSPDSFVLSGTQGLKNFIVRAESNGSGVRGITVVYDQATTGTMESVAIAIANSFQGFPDPNATPPPGQQRAAEYSTAIVVDNGGDLIATRHASEDCDALMVPSFGHAERVAVDKTSDLALIRLYGARDLVPAALAGDSQGNDLTLVGIADPAAQQGRDTETKLTARLDGRRITPAPPLGFSGAAAIDGQGRFAGMVTLQSSADPETGSLTEQATLIPADGVRAFLAAHDIKPAPGSDVIDRSVLRVICVRK